MMRISWWFDLKLQIATDHTIEGKGFLTVVTAFRGDGSDKVVKQRPNQKKLGELDKENGRKKSKTRRDQSQLSCWSRDSEKHRTQKKGKMQLVRKRIRRSERKSVVKGEHVSVSG